MPIKDSKKVETPYQMYLRCLIECKGDLKCEDCCGQKWGDMIYRHIHTIRLPKIEKIDIKFNQQ